MYWDVVEVIPQRDFRLFVRFRDGLAGDVELRPEELTGALAPLAAPEFSARSLLTVARLRGQARSISRRMRCMHRSRAETG